MSEAAPAAGSTPLKNAKHEAVLQAWIADGERVWWRAYSKIYGSEKQRTAEVNASRLLSNAEFAARRDWLLGQISAAVVSAAVMSEVEVLEELSKLGRSSLKDCIIVGDDTDDVVMQLRDLPDHVAATVKALTIDTYVEGAGEDAREVKKLRIELHDKRGALAELKRHYTALTPQKHADPDNRPLGTGAAETLASALSPLDMARRVAFLLEQGKRELAKKSKAQAAKPAKTKPPAEPPAPAPAQPEKA